MTTRFLNQAVHHAEVEFSFHRLGQLPIDGDEQRIKIKRNEFVQTGRMYSRLDEVEFPNSPRMRKGFPSTTSSVAVP